MELSLELRRTTGFQYILDTLTFMGGNVRVGFEDNIYLSKGVKARSNGELVAKVVRISQELGREVGTPADARRILGLPTPAWLK